MMVTRSRTTRRGRLAASVLVVSGLVAAGTGAVSAGTDTTEPNTDATTSGEGAIVGLITKTESNPFFVKMREGAQAKADELGVELRSFAGEFDGDNDAQVTAIEDLIAAGAAGFMITPSDTVAIVPTIEEAREAGLVVIALDTPLEPIDAADATFATDNFRAGELIGQWAAASIEDPESAKIAMLDLAENQPTVDVLRDQGFLTGFGIDVGDDTQWGDEDDPRIVGHDITGGAEEGGRTAMENLLAIDPDINLVYTINEPAAAGARLALDAAGSDAMIVSIDGGCPGVQDVQDGLIGATSMQFPLLMAELGVEAIATGEIPPNTEGLDFLDTGAVLITDNPVEGLESQDTAWGLENCWG
jgi:fructose transport system substrate-binding protein